MALQVIVKSTDLDLASTGIVKALQFGATATSTAYDTAFSQQIRRASRWAETVIQQPLTAQTYRETVAGFGRRSLLLARTPIRQIIAIYDATDTGTATQLLSSQFIIEDAEAGLIARNEGFAWSPALMGHWGVPAVGGDAVPLELTPMGGQERNDWLVDYIAGWSYDGLSTASVNWSTGPGTTDTGRTVPDDVEMAVALEAQAFYRGPLTADVSREKLGDIEVNYRTLGTDRTGRTIRRQDDLLAPYVRVV